MKSLCLTKKTTDWGTRTGSSWHGSISAFLLAMAFGFALSSSSKAAGFEGVVVSIKPLHSLVAAVMKGVDEPKLIVQGAGSAHSYSMKPSDADAMQKARVIFWAGPGLETFLAKPIETLGQGSEIVELGTAKGLKKLPFREGGPFEAHDHGEEGGHDQHHEGGHDHDHEHPDSHKSHAEHAGHDHVHADHDLHFWLDPDNAEALVTDIAARLSEIDPEHARLYQDNAKAYRAGLAALGKQVAAELEPVRGQPFIVFHDAYQYFENRFGLNAVGSITVSPEKAPGAARLRQINEKIVQSGAVCVFSEPQFESRLVNTIIEGTNAKTGVLDPLGADLEPGPELYPQLIRNLAKSLKDCLSPVQ